MTPITPERKRLYPQNWERISLLVRARAGDKCELCDAPNHRLRLSRTSGLMIRTVLTVHHINGDPTDNRRTNLIALCQRCHNRLDQPFRRPRRTTRGNLFVKGG